MIASGLARNLARSLALIAGLAVAFAALPAAAQPTDHSAHQPAPAQSSEPPAQDHSGHDMSGAAAAEPAPGPQPAAEPAPESAPETAGSAADLPVGDAPPPPTVAANAADGVFGPDRMRPSRDQLQREHGGGRYYRVMANIAEFQPNPGPDGFRWDAEAWYGGDLNRLVVKTEGAGAGGEVEEAEVQVLYSRAVSPMFDLQAGVRHDLEPGSRTWATVGFEGMTPYWIDVEGAVFVSDRGDLAARLEGSYDLRLTQRLILQGRAEAELSAQDIPAAGVGSGFSEAELGLRLRYEVRRNFAPYVGVVHERRFGQTADFARAAGEPASETRFVMGLRAWF